MADTRYVADAVAASLGPVLRDLAAGVEPSRLLRDVLTGATAGAGARQGLIVALVEGRVVGLTATGTVPSIVHHAAEEAAATGRRARRRHAETDSGAVAEPIRSGGLVIGAVAVAGDPGRLDADALAPWADLAALALVRLPSPHAGPSALQVLEALAEVGADLDQAGIVNRAFAAARSLFAAQGGLYMLVDGDRARIAHVENVDLDALRTAALDPAFRSFVAAPTLQVAPPGHPALARLVGGAETAVALPLDAGGRRLGHLLLVFGAPLSEAAQALLLRFARQVAGLLRASELARRVTDADARLTGLAHTVSTPVIVADDADRFVAVNPAAAELFHLPGVFVRGQGVPGRLGHEGLEDLFASDGDADVEVVLGAVDPRVYRARLRRLVAPTGGVLAKVLVLEDVTSAVESARVKDDFVAVIGHELRTPLTIVKGYVHMLGRTNALTDDRARETALLALQNNTARLERLIEDLLFVSSVESHTTVDLAPIDLRELVDERQGGRVQVRRPPAPLVVPADRAKLDQVLHHLLDNALKYAEGEVLLEVVDRGEDVEVAVSDHGPGIFSGDVPLLFERFRQLDGSATRSHGGTGLGLYICRRLVELLGGRIWCESRLGVGSRFAFTLPKQGPVAGAARPRHNPLELAQ